VEEEEGERERERGGGRGIKRDSAEVLSSYSGERRGGRGRTARVTRACWPNGDRPCRASHTNKAARLLVN